MDEEKRTAVILTGGYLDQDRAKTAHGLIRHGRRFDILAVMDHIAAADAAKFLNVDYEHPIPIIHRIQDAPRADFLIIGVAPPGGRLPAEWRDEIAYALSHGMNVMSGLHDFLGDDPLFADIAKRCGTSIWDVRRPPADLTCAKGIIRPKPKCPVVLTVGTEAAVGKRTTSLCLIRLAEAQGLDVGFLATGQSGIMIGCDQGVVADRLPADFVSGEIEKRVKWLAGKDKDLIVIEGNGAMSHPAYGPVSHGILVGSHATHLIMCHDPYMEARGSFSDLPIPSVEEEMDMISKFTKAKLLGIALRTRGQDTWKRTVRKYWDKFKVPVLDPIRQSSALYLKRLGLWRGPTLGAIRGGFRKR